MCENVEIELARRLGSGIVGVGESALGALAFLEVFVAVAANCAFLIVPVRVRSACLYVVTNVINAV